MIFRTALRAGFAAACVLLLASSAIGQTIAGGVSHGPPSCLGIALSGVRDELNPISPGLGEAAGASAWVWYDYKHYGRAWEYAATRPSRTFKTPFLVFPQNSKVFQKMIKQPSRGGLVGILVAGNWGLGNGLINEWEALTSGRCR